MICNLQWISSRISRIGNNCYFGWHGNVIDCWLSARHHRESRADLSLDGSVLSAFDMVPQYYHLSFTKKKLTLFILETISTGYINISRWHGGVIEVGGSRSTRREPKLSKRVKAKPYHKQALSIAGSNSGRSREKRVHGSLRYLYTFYYIYIYQA